MGAFTSKDFRFKQRVWFLKEKTTTCPGCATGCQVNVFAREDTRRYFRVKPKESAINAHWMCDRGRKTYEHVNKENRLLFPYADVGQGKAIKVDQDTALDMLVAKLKSVGSDKVGLLVSAQYTNEEYASLFDFFVKKLGVNRVYQWRDPEEDADAFDGILLRGDRNANTNGLLQSMKEAGLSAARGDQFEELAKSGCEVVIALAPEVPNTFPKWFDQIGKLAEMPFVSLWSSAQQVSQSGVHHAFPMKCFTEKVGTFLAHDMSERRLDSSFPSAVADAMSVSEVIDSLQSRI